MNSRWIWVPYKQTHIQQARMDSDRSNTSKFCFPPKFFGNTWRNHFPYMATQYMTEIERTNRYGTLERQQPRMKIYYISIDASLY